MRKNVSDHDPEDATVACVEPERSLPPENPRRALPAWVISMSVHGLLLLAAGAVVLYRTLADEEVPPVHLTTIEAPPPKPPEKIDRDVKENELALDIDAPESDKVSPMTELDVPVEEYSSEEDTEAKDPLGREEAINSTEMGGEGAFMAIGAGGGAAGMFGSRHGGGKKRALGKYGGSKGSENAVDAALRWFKKHQGPDGAWHALTYASNCPDPGAKCEPGESHRNGTKEDAGLTGLAVLCYLGAGYDHRMPSKYKAVVKRGLEWILAMQTANGTIIDGAYNYEHAIATMALCEAYAMSNDVKLRDPAQKAIDVILSRRAKGSAKAIEVATGGYSAPVSGLAWGDWEQTENAKMHTSACGWNVQALKSGLAAGLNVKDGLAGAKIWLEGLWKGTCKMEGKDPAKLDPYRDTTTLAYYWNGETGEATLLDPVEQNVHNLACVGLMCGNFLGFDSGSVMMQTLANHVDRYVAPKAWPYNVYYVYYSTFGVFQLGGQRWDNWNATVRDLIVKAQRVGAGCFDGSWDFTPASHYGAHCGRLVSTALCCLTLEVYYRYLPAAAHGAVGGQGRQRETDRPAKENTKEAR